MDSQHVSDRKSRHSHRLGVYLCVVGNRNVDVTVDLSKCRSSLTWTIADVNDQNGTKRLFNRDKYVSESQPRSNKIYTR